MSLLPAAADAKRKPRACKKGQMTVVLKGRTFKVVKAPKGGRVACLKSIQPARGKSRALASARRLLGSRLLRLRSRTRLERRRTAERLQRYMPRLRALVQRGSGGARSSRSTSSSTENVSRQVFGGKAVPGGKAQATTTSESADRGERGGYNEMTGEVGMGKGDVSFKRSTTYGSGSFGQSCPDAQGRVEATVKWKMGEGIAVGSTPKKGSGDWSVSFETKFEGRVGANGRLQSVSYRGTGALEAKGYNTNGTYGSRVLRLAYSNGPFDRATFLNDANVQRIMRSADVVGRGPRGDNLDAAELKALVSLWGLAEVIGLGDGRKQLLEMEQGWYDRAECVGVKFTPPEGETVRGGTVDADAAAVSKADGSSIAGAPITLAACGVGGTVAPASGGSSLRFRLSDSGRRWDENNPGCVSGETITRRGRGVGLAVFKVRPRPPVPFFDVNIRYERWFTACSGGGEVKIDDATITGSVNAHDPSSEALSRGTGTATGTYRTVVGDNCAGASTHTVAAEPVELTAQYPRNADFQLDPSRGIVFNWLPDQTLRWSSSLWDAPGNGTIVRSDSGNDVRWTFTVTVSNLRSSAD